MWQEAWIRLVRFGFRLLYNEMAWTYDVVSWLVSLGHWRAWQRAALPFVAGQRVLEIGHGPGHLLVELRARGVWVMGLDLSPFMGRLARRRLGAEVPLVRGLVQQLPYESAVFDTILSTFPTEYIVAPETVAALWRVLRANGRLVIVPEGHLTGDGLVHRLIDGLFAITGQRSGAFDFSEDELWGMFTRPFREIGFTVEIHTIQMEGSAATVVVATKAVAGDWRLGRED
ncbi:MAG: methyltransferase domain-containing protein [Ardenticatenaceae bacterium]|nr:methyltransferase domain-containing protein [Ardenticatenaceae bacterium]